MERTSTCGFCFWMPNLTGFNIRPISNRMPGQNRLDHPLLPKLCGPHRRQVLILHGILKRSNQGSTRLTADGSLRFPQNYLNASNSISTAPMATKPASAPWWITDPAFTESLVKKPINCQYLCQGDNSVDLANRGLSTKSRQGHLLKDYLLACSCTQ